MTQYFFTTSRLGFRNWQESDRLPFLKINSDPEIMRFFPKQSTQEESDALLDRLLAHIDQHGFGYFAVDELATNTFIGFIGMSHQNYETPYSPFVDIGWRLSKESWGRGLATEGAQACLDYGFQKLKLAKIYSVTPCNNKPSQNVAEKIGLTKVGEFYHPKINRENSLQPMWMFAKENSE